MRCGVSRYLHRLVGDLLSEAGYRQICIVQDLHEQSGANRLSSMNGNDSSPSVRVAENVVTTSGPCDLESLLAEGADDLSTCETWYSRTHASTATR